MKFLSRYISLQILIVWEHLRLFSMRMCCFSSHIAEHRDSFEISFIWFISDGHRGSNFTIVRSVFRLAFQEKQTLTKKLFDTYNTLNISAGFVATFLMTVHSLAHQKHLLKAYFLGKVKLSIFCKHSSFFFCPKFQRLIGEFHPQRRLRFDLFI